MIAGIINSAGLKEDLPVAMTAPSGVNSGFDRVLHTASKQQSQTNASRESDHLARKDDLARAQYGETAKSVEETTRPGQSAASGKADSLTPESSGEETTKAELDAAIGLAAANFSGVILTEAQPVETPAALVKPAAVMQFNETVPVSELGASPGLQSQLGNAAYRITAHGNTEAQFAEQAGKIPDIPGAPQSPALVLEENKASNPPPLNPVRSESTAELLTFTRQSVAQSVSPQQLVQQAILQGDAQTRNELMMTYGLQQSPQLAETQGALTQQMLGLQRFPADSPMTTRISSSLESTEGTASGLPAPAALPLAGSSALPASTASPVTGDQLVDRIVHEARWLIGNDKQHASFKLHPEHLGEITLKVTQQDGVLKLDMTVLNNSAKLLIESQMDDLRDRLTADEFGAGEFLFNVDVNQGDNQPNRGMFTDEAAPSFSAGHQPTAAEAAPGIPPKLRPLWGVAGVGVYA